MKGIEYRPEDLTYEKRLTLVSDQVDMSRRMRMSELFRLLEEVAVAHTEAMGCTRSETLDRGLLWIITRQLVEIREMPVYDDEIIVRGWQGDMMHVFFPRFCEVIKEGRVVIRAQALWALMDEKTRTMIMPEDYDIELPGRPGSEDMILPAIYIPKEAGDPTAITPMYATFSQMDINGHMNNTSYFNIIDDALWSDLSASRAINNAKSASRMPEPKSVYINYNNELTAGTHYILKTYRDGGTYYFDGTGDKPFFRVKVTY